MYHKAIATSIACIWCKVRPSFHTLLSVYCTKANYELHFFRANIYKTRNKTERNNMFKLQVNSIVAVCNMLSWCGGCMRTIMSVMLSMAHTHARKWQCHLLCICAVTKNTNRNVGRHWTLLASSWVCSRLAQKEWKLQTFFCWFSIGILSSECGDRIILIKSCNGTQSARPKKPNNVSVFWPL